LGSKRSLVVEMELFSNIKQSHMTMDLLVTEDQCNRTMWFAKSAVKELCMLT